MHKILLAESLDADAERRLEAASTVVRAPAADEETLAALIADCDALVARTHTHVTRAVLQAGRQLRVVGVAGVGVDHVDIAAAAELGVAVLNSRRRGRAQLLGLFRVGEGQPGDRQSHG